MYITLLLSGSDVISLELIFVYLYTRINRRYDIKSKYPKEYSTVDEVGSEKL